MLKQQVYASTAGTGEAALALRLCKSEAEIELPVPPIASALETGQYLKPLLLVNSLRPRKKKSQHAADYSRPDTSSYPSQNTPIRTW